MNYQYIYIWNINTGNKSNSHTFMALEEYWPTRSYHIRTIYVATWPYDDKSHNYRAAQLCRMVEFVVVVAEVVSAVPPPQLSR